MEPVHVGDKREQSSSRAVQIHWWEEHTGMTVDSDRGADLFIHLITHCLTESTSIWWEEDNRSQKPVETAEGPERIITAETETHCGFTAVKNTHFYHMINI